MSTRLLFVVVTRRSFCFVLISAIERYYCYRLSLLCRLHLSCVMLFVCDDVATGYTDNRFHAVVALCPPQIGAGDSARCSFIFYIAVVIFV